MIGKKQNTQSGMILLYEVIITVIFSTVMLAVLANAVKQLQVIRSSVNREKALQIAEAGLNYYQWRLAHFPSDYQDGTGAPGPYLHDYVDSDSNTVIGRYSLVVTAPPTGSTIVTIQSTGYTLDNPNQRRVITARYGIPSLAKYAFLTNESAWIGDTETIHGEFHANGGIRFDGTGDAPITSSRSTYNCPGWSGSPCPTSKPGIWGTAPQSTKNFWNFPVPNLDFSSITSDLATIKSDAQDLGDPGIYLPPSSHQGYLLVFKPDGTVDVNIVNGLRASPTGWDVNSTAHNEDIDYNPAQVQLLYNRAIPANGLFFVEDNTWVEGTIHGRAMVATAKLPYNPVMAPRIYISNNLVYSTKDGSDVLGLISQRDIVIGYYAPSNLEIDAAMIAQNGSAQAYYYQGSVNVKNSISIYGSVSSFGVWTWSWVNDGGTIVSGFQNTGTTYDPNLLYAPPPDFPLVSSGYQQISWTSN